MYIERYTYSDYENWEGDWELIDGVPLAMAPSPLGIHQIIAFKIAKELEDMIEKCEECYVLLEEDYIVSDKTVIRPDVAVVCNYDIYSFIKQTPLLIVEVVSESSVFRDEEVKFKIYEKEGVEWYLIAYPNFCKVKVYRLIDGKYKKVGDFTNEKLKLKLQDCEGEVDFKRVFKKIKCK
jgi:Uma2 family endonuclease